MTRYIFFLLAAVLVAAPHSHSETETTENKAMPSRGVCAHRGAMDTHPENTLAAFREALRLGAHMIEFDVRLTKDKQLVILHDETVDRTTDGSGRISAFTLAEAKKLDAGSWKSEEFKDERLPTLKETLAVMPRTIWLNIHLKGGENLGRQVAEAVAADNRIEQSFLACGYAAAAGAKSAAPSIKICNMERQSQTSAYAQQTIERKNEFIQLLNTPLNNELAAMMQQLKQHRIKINYCCTDDAQKIKELYDSGVDFILVNHLKAALKVAESLGIPPNRPR